MKNNYEIRGDVTVIFIRHKGRIVETFIDTVDLPKVASHPRSWFAIVNTVTRPDKLRVFAHNDERKTFYLHRYVTDAPPDVEVDHINCDPMDNRKANLRFSTKTTNGQNREAANRNSVTGIRGVSPDPVVAGCWAIDVSSIEGKRIRQRFHGPLEQAAKIVAELRAKHQPYSKEGTQVAKIPGNC